MNYRHQYLWENEIRSFTIPFVPYFHNVFLSMQKSSLTFSQKEHTCKSHKTIYEPSIEFFLSFVLMDRGQNTLWHGNIQTVTWTSRSHANVDIILSVQSTFSFKIFYSKCNYSIAAWENKSKVQIPTTDPQNDTFCTGVPLFCWNKHVIL